MHLFRSKNITETITIKMQIVKPTPTFSKASPPHQYATKKKILMYKQIIHPAILYGIQLWGSVKTYTTFLSFNLSNQLIYV